MNKISFYNHKGGVGKTTSVVNTAYFLAKQDKKILVVDCDSQKNCFGFFSAHENIENISYTTWKQLPLDYSDFDYLLLDLPPALTYDVQQMLKFSDTVYVPIKLGAYEIKGLTDVTTEIQKQGTRLGGVFITMFRNGNKTDSKNLEIVKEILGRNLIECVIPNSDAVMNSQIEEMFIEEYLNFKKLPNTPIQRKIVTAYEQLPNYIIKGVEK